VMAKIDRPARLIAYDTDLNIKRRQEGKPALYNLVRARTVLYVAIIAAVGAIMLYTLATRSSEGISVIHDRNPMFVRLSSGELRNAFTVRILNKSLETRDFVLTVDGLTDLDLRVVGDVASTGRMAVVAVGPDQTHELRVLVSTFTPLPPAASIPLTFRISDPKTGQRASAVDHFRGP
jgi:polyferredoxin